MDSILAEIIPPAAYIMSASNFFYRSDVIIYTVSATDTVSFRSLRSVVTSVTISRIAFGGNSEVSEFDILRTGIVTTVDL